MAGRISRRLLTEYIADRLVAGDATVIEQLAAYLIEIRRTKEVDLYVRDIEYALIDRGVVVADVTSAHHLAAETQEAVTRFLGTAYAAKTVELRQSLDASLIGGINIQTADAEYDTTVKRKITNLQKMKV